MRFGSNFDQGGEGGSLSQFLLRYLHGHVRHSGPGIAHRPDEVVQVYELVQADGLYTDLRVRLLG
jgi:hypothetical protein